MAKSVFTDTYAAFLEGLIALRKSAGVTQVELARRLGKPQQFVSRYELGIRRIDVVEFWAIAKALDVEPRMAFARVTDEFPAEVAI
jgi:transcriptional regulator with XRE-family HTH domain